MPRQQVTLLIPPDRGLLTKAVKSCKKSSEVWDSDLSYKGGVSDYTLDPQHIGREALVHTLTRYFLLPLPLTQETLKHIVGQLTTAQGVQISEPVRHSPKALRGEIVRGALGIRLSKWTNGIHHNERRRLFKTVIRHSNDVILPFYEEVAVVLNKAAFPTGSSREYRNYAIELAGKLQALCAEWHLEDFIPLVIVQPAGQPDEIDVEAYQSGAERPLVLGNPSAAHRFPDEMDPMAQYSMQCRSRFQRAMRRGNPIRYEYILVRLPPLSRLSNVDARRQDMEERISAFRWEILQALLVRFRWQAVGDPELIAAIHRKISREQWKGIAWVEGITDNQISLWCKIIHEVILRDLYHGAYCEDLKSRLPEDLHASVERFENERAVERAWYSVKILELARRQLGENESRVRGIGPIAYRTLILLLYASMRIHKRGIPVPDPLAECAAVAMSSVDGPVDASSVKDALEEVGKSLCDATPWAPHTDQLLGCVLPLFEHYPFTRILKEVEKDLDLS